MSLLVEYMEKYGRVDVTVGPLFDYNADGLRDDNLTRSVRQEQTNLSSHYSNNRRKPLSIWGVDISMRGLFYRFFPLYGGDGPC